ncbi:tagatose-6-phosphate kinase [Tetragenococcus halophilus subsp. flandriensis]|uniref:1-phosphofructokinase family hexose kinase n=1 Tax=Tetragenococcus halophilus TaxID=51669 RepID=UPI0023E9E230|nr:hexose kinase [Tetragenococcus halophilus]GMA08752.1 tagatose-6-phosphate kinase [Tetragenococcus halophilus subsp. flandriensis]
MIYTVTLSPAIDNIIKTNETLTRGKNNRISGKTLDVGGKGTHVSVGLTLLGEENICTGITGKKDIEVLMDLLRQYHVKASFYTASQKEVRNNFVLTDQSGKGSFMITDYGFALTKEMVESFFLKNLDSLNSSDTVIISGNPSMYTPTEVFRLFLEKLVEKNVRIVADVSDVFLYEVLKKKIYLIKPNQYEFSDMVGEEVHTLEDCIRAYKKNYTKLQNVEHISVSLGIGGSVFLSKEQIYTFTPPQVKTINDTGSGDAFLSGLVFGLLKGYSIEDIGVLATAIGASKAEEEKSTGFSTERVKDLKSRVIYKKIG